MRKICDYCGREFESDVPHKRFHSEACRKAAWRAKKRNSAKNLKIDFIESDAETPVAKASILDAMPSVKPEIVSDDKVPETMSGSFLAKTVLSAVLAKALVDKEGITCELSEDGTKLIITLC